MTQPIDRSHAVAAVGFSAAATATPDFSTATNPPSIFFSGHPHILAISGAELDAAAAKPAGTETVFTVTGTHQHNLHLTTEQAKVLIRDGVVKSNADGGHTHVVTFKPQASGDVLAFVTPIDTHDTSPSTVRTKVPPVAVASRFPKDGIVIPDSLYYFVRSSVDGQYMGRGVKNGEKRSMTVADTATTSSFTFDFGAYDPAFAKDFIYFQGFDEKKAEVCFVVPMSFLKEQASSGLPTLNKVNAPVHKTFSLEWFAKNAPDTLIRIPGVLVYQDLPVSGRFAVQCTGQVWDEGINVPTNIEYIPAAFPPLGEIWLTPLATPTEGFKIPVGEVGNTQLNDVGDRVVAQRVINGKCEFVVYELRGEVAAGAQTPTLHEIYKLAAQADKADMLGHDRLTFERRAGAERSEIVLHDIVTGKDTILASAKPDCVFKFPHFVAQPKEGGVEVRFVEQQWTKDAAGNYNPKPTNIFKRVTIQPTLAQ